MGTNGGIWWKEHKLEGLFKKLECTYYGPGARHSDIANTKTEEYCVPVTTVKKGNNGICRWAKQGYFKTYKNVISIVYNGAIATGLSYYQPDDISSLTDSYLIELIQGSLNEYTGLYLSRAIQKKIKEKYSREKKAVWSRVKEESILLPTTSTGSPDYDFMERYIRAIEKVVIKNTILWKVVIKNTILWKDVRIAAAKQMIQNTHDAQTNPLPQ